MPHRGGSLYYQLSPITAAAPITAIRGNEPRAHQLNGGALHIISRRVGRMING
jgi:hypothetical protein